MKDGTVWASRKREELVWLTGQGDLQGTKVKKRPLRTVSARAADCATVISPNLSGLH